MLSWITTEMDVDVWSSRLPTLIGLANEYLWRVNCNTLCRRWAVAGRSGNTLTMCVICYRWLTFSTGLSGILYTDEHITYSFNTSCQMQPYKIKLMTGLWRCGSQYECCLHSCMTSVTALYWHLWGDSTIALQRFGLVLSDFKIRLLCLRLVSMWPRLIGLSRILMQLRGISRR